MLHILAELHGAIRAELQGVICAELRCLIRDVMLFPRQNTDLGQKT
jgi:hypothetical protein